MADPEKPMACPDCGRATALECKLDPDGCAKRRIVGSLREQLARVTQERDTLRAEKHGAYSERNKCVILLARMALALGYRAGVAQHEDKPGEVWDADWRTIVFIDLPVGQVSWHFHDSEKPLLVGLPDYAGKWDGHDTPAKYARVLASWPRNTAPLLRRSRRRRGGDRCACRAQNLLGVESTIDDAGHTHMRDSCANGSSRIADAAPLPGGQPQREGLGEEEPQRPEHGKVCPVCGDSVSEANVKRHGLIKNLEGGGFLWLCAAQTHRVTPSPEKPAADPGLTEEARWRARAVVLARAVGCLEPDEGWRTCLRQDPDGSLPRCAACAVLEAYMPSGLLAAAPREGGQGEECRCGSRSLPGEVLGIHLRDGSLHFRDSCLDDDGAPLPPDAPAATPGAEAGAGEAPRVLYPDSEGRCMYCRTAHGGVCEGMSGAAPAQPPTPQPHEWKSPNCDYTLAELLAALASRLPPAYGALHDDALNATVVFASPPPVAAPPKEEPLLVTCSTDTEEHIGPHTLRPPTRDEKSWCLDPVPAAPKEEPPRGCPECAAPQDCQFHSPADWNEHWREFHRGHGCKQDPDAAAPPAAGKEPR